MDIELYKKTKNFFEFKDTEIKSSTTRLSTQVWGTHGLCTHGLDTLVLVSILLWISNPKTCKLSIEDRLELVVSKLLILSTTLYLERDLAS